MNIKSRLLRSKKTVDLDEQGADDHLFTLKASDKDVIVLTTTDAKVVVSRWTKTIVGAVALVVVLLSVIYVGLAATVMAAVPVDGGRLWVARGTFVGGMVPSGSIVYASQTSARPQSMTDKALEGFIGIQDPLVAEIISGPFAQVSSNENGEIIVDGKVVGGYTGAVEPQLLDNEYLGLCVDGSCAEDELIIIPSSNISSEVKAFINTSGVQNVEPGSHRRDS